MKSRVMQGLKAEQRKRFAAMTPESRLAMTERLANEWLAEYTDAHHVTREAALESLRASRRAGRKPSRCASR